MKKRALIVGVNYYQLSLVPTLHFCHNDAMEMQSLLGARGFDLLTILDAERQAEIEGIKWLREGMQSGDRFCYYHSGHGTPTRDWDGDEEDGFDESLVPNDYDGTIKSLLTDDEINALFSPVPDGVIGELIFDACHSGTMSRDFGRKNPVAWLHPNKIHRFLSVAACRDDQTSVEELIGIEGKEGHGVFTWALLEQLREKPGTTWLQTVEGINQRLRSGLHDQIAQLEGPARLINGYPFGGL